MLPQLAPDGGWEEGVNYWGYNADYFMRLIGALDSALGSDFGIMRYKGLDKTVQFAISQESPLGMNNFHDAAFCNIEITPVTWFAKKFQDANAMRYRRFTAEHVNTYRKAYDLIYYDPELAEGAITYPLDWYTRGVEALSSKSSLPDKNGLFFAAQGGKTSCYHSHPDTGAFVFDLLGERWSEDLGMDTYTPTASAEYYYRKRTEGHSTIVINPDETAGQLDNTFSPVIWFDSKDTEWTGILDMTAPYSNNADRVWRGFYVGDNRTSLTIRDEIDLKSAESTVYWFMQTAADVTCTENGTVLTKNGKKLRLRFETNGTDVKIQATKAVVLPTSPSLPEDIEKNAAYNRIAISYTGSGSTYITVKLSAYDAPDKGINMGPLKELMATPEEAAFCIFEEDFDGEAALENGWYTVDAPGFSFYDGTRTVNWENIIPSEAGFYGYENMKYRMYLNEEDIGNSISIGYNPEYDTFDDAGSGSEDPYIVYEIPDTVYPRRDAPIVFQARFRSDAPAGTIAFRLEDTYGNKNYFVRLVQFRDDGNVYCATEATNWSAKFLCNWEKETVYTVTVIFRNGSGNCDIYINDTMVAQQFPLFADDRGVRNLYKVYLYANYTGTVPNAQKLVYFDGIKLYSGTAITGEAYGTLKQNSNGQPPLAEIKLDVVDLEQQIEPALAVAEYDHNGKLLGVMLETVPEKVCGTAVCRYPMTDQGSLLKLFVFASLEQIIPVRPATEMFFRQK